MTEAEQLKLRREDLECAKLKAEIAREELEGEKLKQETAVLRAWWKRPATLASFAATLASIATIVTVVTAWLAGYFPGEREKLKQEIAELRQDRDARLQEALLVNSDLERLRADKQDLLSQAEAVRRENHALSDETESLERDLHELQDRLSVVWLRSWAMRALERGRVQAFRDKSWSPPSATTISVLYVELMTEVFELIHSRLGNLVSTRLSVNFGSPFDGFVDSNGIRYSFESILAASDAEILEWFRDG